MKYIIWGWYKNDEPEEIDETDSLAEALDLAREYRMAFGIPQSDWKVRVKDERGRVIN